MWFFWKNSHVFKLIRNLEHQLHHLEHEIHHLKKQVNHVQEELQQVHFLKEQIHQLSKKVKQLESLYDLVEKLEDQLLTGLTENPELEAFLKLKIGMKVRIETAGTSLQGIILVVGTDAVELREANGDLLIIPFSHINAVQ
ncbi:hypothetical protein GRF59_08060 [Paenibacillus sp. HJL G12]|uniref:DUF2642 domain-containing protein n=1 Tax=Paenibacillus dendrobii TaxID=2691084 RepID=A0A7X3IHE6_9BACL|nr:hypothetical protein [Paenibacillus dendrobii]MWV43588.1 hypothetical protein [Paenibacillus dendrobii]